MPQYSPAPIDEKPPPITDVINSTVRLDTNLDAFERKGGANMFEANLARGLGIPKDNVEV